MFYPYKSLCIRVYYVYNPVSVRHCTTFSFCDMPKLKNHSGAKKRFRVTGSGQLAFRRNSRQHLLTQKNKRQKRLNRTRMLSKTNEKHMNMLLPM